MVLSLNFPIKDAQNTPAGRVKSAGTSLAKPSATVDYRHYQYNMNLACSPAQVAGKLVIQIQNLLHAPDSPLKTTERSPLFQIAAFIELPKLAAPENVGPAITGQTFAQIRDEALQPQNTVNGTASAKRCRARRRTLQNSPAL